MPSTLTYPGIYIQELPSSVHTLTPAPTSVAVFVGYTHPFKTAVFGQPVRLFGFTDYERNFGGFFSSEALDAAQDESGSVAIAVNQFFINGGSDCYVIGVPPKLKVGDTASSVAVAKSGAIDKLAFTAREPVDSSNKITVTVQNVSTDGKQADVLVTYEAGAASRAEMFRAVGSDQLNNGKINTIFVEARIGTSARPVSSLVTVAADSAFARFAEGTITLAEAKAVTLDFDSKAFTNVFRQDGNLDKLPIFNLLCIPGVTDNGVLSTALAFCEQKLAFFIMDPPRGATADAANTIEDTVTGANAPPKSHNGALYFPYLRSSDPLTGHAIEIPPSGTVAGVYARTDSARGVWKAPAGLAATVLNSSGVVASGNMTEQRHGTLNPIGVNVLRDFPGVGTAIFGARTLVTANAAEQQWRYVPVRRTALFLEQTLLRNLGWVVFEPNDEPLWLAIRTSIESFMLGLFRQGAFQGTTPSQAFQVKCDSQTTTQADIDNGIVNIVVAFAPLKPAEFVVVKIAQLAGQTSS